MMAKCPKRHRNPLKINNSSLPSFGRIEKIFIMSISIGKETILMRFFIILLVHFIRILPRFSVETQEKEIDLSFAEQVEQTQQMLPPHLQTPWEYV